MAHGMPFDWAVASRPKPGESETGDRQIVVPYTGGVLVAVVDALGHGGEAAASAAIAENVLRSTAKDSIISQARDCHAALRGKRGVVMSLAKFDWRPGIMSWLGVGNVDAVLYRPAATEAPKTRLVTRGGVVGSSLPDLRAEVLDVSSGGLLLFATDGIESAFGDADIDPRKPQDIVTDFLKRFAKPTDDALVLAARFGPGVSS